MHTNHTQQGFSLIEVLLAFALFTIMVATLTEVTLMPDILGRRLALHAHAVDFAIEGLLAARALRDADSDLLTPGPHGIAFDDESGWRFVGTTTTTQ